MISTETLFFAAFLVFILAILALDLGIFDRNSHEVKFREALLWTGIWVALALGFYLFILLRGNMIHGLESIEEIQAQIIKYKHSITLPADVTLEKALQIYRNNLGLEFITGYLIEYMLSVDNVFVIILIFLSFGVQKMYYKRVLFWGILGAIVMRFIFIFLASALIQRFEWILYLFGVFLVFTGIKMYLNRNKEDKVDPKKHPVVRFASKYFRIYPEYFRQHFWFRNKHENNKLYFTPLFLVLLVIEFTDVIFAVDSVPAIFSVTHDPYIVFFSNVFAILGLRSLFFLVANVINLFRFLKHGLSILLTFIGFKMLLHVQLEAWGFTTMHSLFFVMGILGISILASLIWPENNRKRKKMSEELTTNLLE